MKKWIVLILLFQPVLIYGQAKVMNYGGKEEKRRIFNQEVYYSPLALEKYYGGKIELSFIINSKGQADSIEVIQSVSRDLDKEAKRLLKLLLWAETKTSIKPKTELRTISFRFNPKKYAAICKQRGYELTQPNEAYLFTMFLENEVSQRPKFIGKEQSFNDFVKENLSYPEDAIKTKAEGFVSIKFVVEPTGRLTNIHISESLEANCDIVARDLILKSKWSPGLQNGLPVRCLLTRKIYFSPSGDIRFISIPDRN